MGFTFLAALFAVGLCLGMLFLEEAGRRWGLKRAERYPEGGREGLAAVEAAIYGLLGLLIAFSFSGAASRFETRRHLITEEANAIGTAYLRLDLLPAEAQPSLRDKFRLYLDSRLAAYRKLPDLEAARAELARSVTLQGEIWTESVAAARAAGPPASVLLPPALNAMIDITTTRIAATRDHPPPVLYVMLVLIALVSAFLVGQGMAGSKAPGGLHRLAYAAVLSAVIYVIIDLEFPRMGLIRVDAADRLLVEVRESMK